MQQQHVPKKIKQIKHETFCLDKGGEAQHRGTKIIVSQNLTLQEFQVDLPSDENRHALTVSSFFSGTFNEVKLMPKSIGRHWDPAMVY